MKKFILFKALGYVLDLADSIATRTDNKIDDAIVKTATATLRFEFLLKPKKLKEEF